MKPEVVYLGVILKYNNYLFSNKITLRDICSKKIGLSFSSKKKTKKKKELDFLRLSSIMYYFL